MADAPVSFKRTKSSKLQECPKVDGQVVVLTDIPGAFYDALDENSNLIRHSVSEFTYRCTGTANDGTNVEQLITKLLTTFDRISLSIVGQFGLDTNKDYQITVSGYGGGKSVHLDFSNCSIIPVDNYNPIMAYFNHGGDATVSGLYTGQLHLECSSITIKDSNLIVITGSSNHTFISNCRFSTVYGGDPVIDISCAGYLHISSCFVDYSGPTGRTVNAILIEADATNILVENNVLWVNSKVLLNESEVDPKYNNLVLTY